MSEWVPKKCLRCVWNGGSSWTVCSCMETAAQYRKFAEECERLAKQASAAHHRKVLEEMAQVWRTLADGADGKG
jgi:hypothetical protein